jgi:hypothetical protein
MGLPTDKRRNYAARGGAFMAAAVFAVRIAGEISAAQPTSRGATLMRRTTSHGWHASAVLVALSLVVLPTARLGRRLRRRWWQAREAEADELHVSGGRRLARTGLIRLRDWLDDPDALQRGHRGPVIATGGNDPAPA